MNFLINLLNNIAADIVFWLGLGFLIWLAVQIAQSHFLKFFGLETNKTLVVYLSNLWEPTREKSEGYLLSEYEFRAVESINGLFGSTPFSLPEFVRGLVDSFWIGKRPNITTTVSPLTNGSIAFTNMIVVGGVSKNSVRKHYVDIGAPYLVVHPKGTATDGEVQTMEPCIQVMKGHRKGEIITGDYEFAIVEKIYDAEHQTTVFMCVGYRGEGSLAATEYLVRQWGELRKRFGDKPFALCLGFSKSGVSIEEPLILASFPSNLA